MHLINNNLNKFDLNPMQGFNNPVATERLEKFEPLAPPLKCHVLTQSP